MAEYMLWANFAVFNARVVFCHYYYNYKQLVLKRTEKSCCEHLSEKTFTAVNKKQHELLDLKCDSKDGERKMCPWMKLYQVANVPQLQVSFFVATNTHSVSITTIDSRSHRHGNPYKLTPDASMLKSVNHGVGLFFSVLFMRHHSLKN